MLDAADRPLKKFTVPEPFAMLADRELEEKREARREQIQPASRLQPRKPLKAAKAASPPPCDEARAAGVT
jgi:hypothetical protein